MKHTIYCKTAAKGEQSFYIVANGETHFLFRQNFRRGVKEYFGQGVCLDRAMNFAKAKGNTALMHTMEKLPTYIKYIEREYGLEVLKSTARRNANQRKKSA